MARDLVLELKGHEVRHEDIICLNDRGGDAFLVFFSPKRREGPLRIADLKAAADRVEGHINRKLSRLASPYLGTLRRVSVGFALSFYNPLVMPERLVSRLVEEAWSCVHVLKAQRDLQDRCELQEVLLTDQLSTVFQPIVELRPPQGARLRGALARAGRQRLPDAAAPVRDGGRGGPGVRARPQVPPPRAGLGRGAAARREAVRERVPVGDVRPRVPGHGARGARRVPRAHPRPRRARDHREVGDRELRRLRRGARRAHASTASRSRSTTSAPATPASRRSRTSTRATSSSTASWCATSTRATSGAR